MTVSTWKLTKTENTNLGLASTYEVETYFNSGAIIADSKKKVSKAFSIVFDMKGATKLQKVKAINKSGLDLSLEEWDALFSSYADFF